MHACYASIGAVIADSTVSLNEDSSLTLNLTANAIEVPGYTLSPQIGTQPAHGTLTPTAPGIVSIRVIATDVDGNTSTKTSSILVADPNADQAPALAWGGALVGDWGSGGNNLPPMVVTQPALLQAQISDVQLMGWQLQIAQVGTNQWSTIASQQDSAVAAAGLVDLATNDRCPPASSKPCRRAPAPCTALPAARSPCRRYRTSRQRTTPAN